MVVLQRVFYVAVAALPPANHADEVRQNFMARFCVGKFFGMLMEFMLKMKLTDGYFTFGRNLSDACFFIA